MPERLAFLNTADNPVFQVAPEAWYGREQAERMTTEAFMLSFAIAPISTSLWAGTQVEQETVSKWLSKLTYFNQMLTRKILLFLRVTFSSNE